MPMTRPQLEKKVGGLVRLGHIRQVRFSDQMTGVHPTTTIEVVLKLPRTSDSGEKGRISFGLEAKLLPFLEENGFRTAFNTRTVGVYADHPRLPLALSLMHTAGTADEKRAFIPPTLRIVVGRKGANAMNANAAAMALKAISALHPSTRTIVIPGAPFRLASRIKSGVAATASGIYRRIRRRP